MRAQRSLIFAIFLALAASHPLLARQDLSSGRRLVSQKEGEAIVQVALAYGRQSDSKPDCSHLVHEIYSSAGLDYSFAASRQLYHGVDAFARVAHAQPGDLIVWRGHVGIVVSSREHTFYSSLRSGVTSDSYDSPYWQSRGRPRFYRFLLDRDRESPLLARADDATGPPSTRDNRPVRSVRSPASLIEVRQVAGQARAAEDDDSPAVGPERFVWVSAQPKPSREELLSALLNHSAFMARQLQGNELLDLSKEIEVVNKIEVGKIKVKGDRGWAELQIQQAAGLAENRVHARNIQKQRINLLRVHGGWSITPEAGLYLPHSAAVKVLANQLALLSRTSMGRRDMRSVLQLLDVVLQAEQTYVASGRQ